MKEIANENNLNKENVKKAGRMHRFLHSRPFKYICLGLSAIVVGAGVGLGMGFGLKPARVQTIADGASYAVNELYMKEAKALYDGAKDSGTPLNEALTPDQMVNLAYSFYSEKESAKAVGVGSSKAMGIVDQEIQSCSIKEGDKYFEESNSIGMVKIYNRMYEEGDTTTTYWGSDSDYASHPEDAMTNEEYAELMGRTVSTPLSYIVSPKTVRAGETLSGMEPTGAKKNEDGTYTVYIELDVKDSGGSKVMPGVSNYQKQMKQISGLSGYPNFEYCHLTFLFSEDLLPIEFTNDEKYEAAMGIINATCIGAMTTYYLDGDATIPSLSEKIDYSAYQA